MSTHSFIGIIENNIIKGIYCHFNGFLEGNGKMLFEHYQDDDKIKNLISLGSISCVNKEVNPTENHDFDHPQKDVVIAYHRDRGEELEIDMFDNIKDFKQYVNSFYFQYSYIRYNKKWYVVKNINETTIDCIELNVALQNVNKAINEYSECQQITI